MVWPLKHRVLAVAPAELCRKSNGGGCHVGPWECLSKVHMISMTGVWGAWPVLCAGEVGYERSSDSLALLPRECQQGCDNRCVKEAH